jgi:hypothetical protein
LIRAVAFVLGRRRTLLHPVQRGTVFGNTVRRIDGKAVLLYARRPSAPAGTKAPKAKFEPKGKDVSALVDGLNALGLTTATAAHVQRVAEELYPKGMAAIDHAEVLRAVFLRLKGQNSAGKVRR